MAKLEIEHRRSVSLKSELGWRSAILSSIVAVDVPHGDDRTIVRRFVQVSCDHHLKVQHGVSGQPDFTQL
jgi:hypothetical protein